MAKHILTILFLFACLSDCMATHTKGGWMYYEYLGAGINDPTKLRYRIVLKYYIDCPSGIADNPINLTIFNNKSPYTLVDNVSAFFTTNNSVQNCNLTQCYPCISNIPLICYRIYSFEATVELAPSVDGYVISKQRCCRVFGIANLTPPSGDLGATWTIAIPGVLQDLPNSFQNNSPKFIFNDTAIVCGNNYFSLNFGAIDDNGDSLVYSFCEAYNNNGGDVSPPVAFPPPYPTVPYLFPQYSGARPLGAQVTLDPLTGIASGIAPPPGEYVVTVCVKEFRNGILFAESRKELHLKVASCTPVAATLDPTYITCGDLILSFSNQSDNASITKWFWTFGDPASGPEDSSDLQFPTHEFTAPGVYTVKLIVNRGLACTDSTTQEVHVFPGFFPGFAALPAFCVGKPIQFNDTTRTNHGTVNYWKWDFGDPATLADTSRIKNPAYTYNTPGNYTIKLVSGNSMGCRDSLTHIITVSDNPVVAAFPKDTTYCALDSIQLNALGTGNFNWLPNTRILNAGTANPIAFPTATTKYYVTLTAPTGCTDRDSVTLRPINDLTNAITTNPATICQEDSLILSGSSNHNDVSWQWSPAASLLTPNAQQTVAFPMATTTYTLRTRWGNNCVATRTVNIPVTPLAIPNAGPDSTFCLGQDPVPLTASGGLTYSWSPATGLSNPNIANPLASPTVSTDYIVSVGVNGCPRLKNDTVRVNVRSKPMLTLSPDTLICNIDTLQVFANGTGSFTWSPDYMIIGLNSPSPLVSPDVPTRYNVRLMDAYRCFTDSSIFIDVKPFVTINAGPDTSICQSEGYKLRASGDALSWEWSPNLYLDNNMLKNPFASPPVTTTYTLVGNIGKCQSSDAVTIKVGPYPPANAGTDTLICSGFDAQLQASGGSSYLWSPPTFLSNRNIANPRVINPTGSIKYVVAVTDTLGCTVMVRDTIVVTVIPRLHVDAGPPDTNVVDGQSLQLRVSGARTYLWSPSTWLSSNTSAGPVSSPQADITYYVIGTDQHGCQGTDSIRVHLYTVEPDMYVPTAFTPNGDYLNDVIRPTLLGMKSLTYFRVYNRLGELVFYTSEIGRGWNGIYKGKPQDAGTFVWYAEGVTFKNQVKKNKGYVVLIR